MCIHKIKGLTPVCYVEIYLWENGCFWLPIVDVFLFIGHTPAGHQEHTYVLPDLPVYTNLHCTMAGSEDNNNTLQAFTWQQRAMRRYHHAKFINVTHMRINNEEANNVITSNVFS